MDGRDVMRTFSCFTFEKDQTVPVLTFLFTSSLERAREIARRELLRDKGVAVEICDGDRLLWTEVADPG
jgi:hypothetical protein